MEEELGRPEARKGRGIANGSSSVNSNTGGVGEDPYPSSLAETFTEMFATYLYFGMSYDEYWYKDPALAVAYREAYDMKRQYDNEYAWLQGVYFLRANAADKNNPYPKKPLDMKFNGKTNTKQEEKAHMDYMQANFQRFAMYNNKRIENEKEKGE